MATRPLTDSTLRSAILDSAATGTPLDLRDCEPGKSGLRCRVQPSGVATYTVSVTKHGKTRRLPVGPSRCFTSVAKARARAWAVKGAFMAGVDPVAEGRAARAELKAQRAARKAVAVIASGPTLNTVLAQYETYRSPNLPKTWLEVSRRFHAIFGPLLNVPMTLLTRKDMQAAVDAYASKSSATVALAMLKPAIRWGSEQEKCSEDLLKLKAPGKPKSRTRVLDESELRRLLPVMLSEHQAGNRGATVHLLLLLTCARRDEVADATYADINWTKRILTVPEHRAKTGKEYRLVLSPHAIALLRDVCQEDAAPSDRIFLSVTGLPISNWSSVTQRLQTLSVTSCWHRHDLRRTGATIMQDDLPCGEYEGVPVSIVSAVLQHAMPGSDAAYLRGDFSRQKARAVQLLGNYLWELGNLPPIATADNVVPIRAAEAA